MMQTFERRVEVRPSYCLIRPEPRRNYGVCACHIEFAVIGPKGAVEISFSTDWWTTPALNHLSQFPARKTRQPEGRYIGQHAKSPTHQDQSPTHDCAFTGGVCYFDCSYLYADEWVEGFVNGGTKWLWPKLEEYYRHVFDGGDAPDLTPVPVKHPDEKGEPA